MASVVESNWRAWWPAQTDAIVVDVRARLAAAVAAWRLTALEALPGGEVALVFAVATPDREAVLKLSPRVAGETDAMAHEGSALELWARAGIAPRVLAMPDGRRAAREHVLALTELYAGAAALDRERIEAWIRIRALAIVGDVGHPVVSGHGRAWSERLLRLADALA